MRRRAKFEQVVFCDPFAMAGQRKIAVELANDGTVNCLEWSVGDYCVRCLRIEQASLGSRYTAIDQPVFGQATSFKISALQHGATPEAIRLLGAIVPVSKQEEAIMAEKLKTKGADKDGLKAAAKAAPVGGRKVKEMSAATKVPTEPAPAKKRGNPEALAKARAARDTGPDTRKMKPLVKTKDLTAREGSFRRTMIEDALTSKTVAEWREKNKKYDAGCLKFLVDNGMVSVG